MNRCQHPDARSRNLPYRIQLRLSPQLVHCHHLWIHHPEQQRHGLILGTAGQHVGAGTQIQGVFPLLLSCQLPALIYYANPYALGTQLPDQIPEKRGFSASRRRENQCGIQVVPLPKAQSRLIRCPRNFPGKSNHQGGNMPKTEDFPVPQHRFAAQSHTAAVFQRQIQPRFLHSKGIGRAAGCPVHERFEQRIAYGNGLSVPAYQLLAPGKHPRDLLPPPKSKLTQLPHSSGRKLLQGKIQLRC